jgi:ribonucleoside-triphosphate reductase
MDYDIMIGTLMINLEDNVSLIDDYLNRSDWRVRENANSGYSFQGLNFQVATSEIANYCLDNIYPKYISDAHRSGRLHIHDLGMGIIPYCCGWDLYDILMRGFGGVEGKVQASPAKHFSSALGQLVNFFYTLAGELAGAVAVSNFDTLLAPFVRYDNLDYNQVKQFVQEFVYNMNSPTRLGFQSVFSNITFDLTPSPNYANQSVVIGGELQNQVYGDFQFEMDLINKAFCEVMLEGDASGRVFTFPIPTYNLFKGFDWENKELLWKMTGKYGIPNWANFINSELKPEDTRSLCCRLRLDRKKLQKRAGGLFAASSLTGSLGVVTINMPRIGYETDNPKEFMRQLSHTMDVAKESLETKREIVEENSRKGLFPYSEYYLDSVYQVHNQYWANHFSTIGLNGMHEACLNLFGYGIDTRDGKWFAEDVLDFMLQKLQGYQDGTGNLYNLEASPCESATYRMAKADKKMYPDIITAGTDEIPFYSNSTHLPVNADYDIVSVIEHQNDLQKKYNGGTIVHLFLGEAIDDWKNVRAFVKTIAEQFEIPYFTLTPTFSVCKNHGYLKGNQPICPYCNETTEVYSRVVGYLRPVKNWNDAKQIEFSERKTYTIT